MYISGIIRLCVLCERVGKLEISGGMKCWSFVLFFVACYPVI